MNAIEEKVIAYKDLSEKIKELEEQKKILASEILQTMPKEVRAFSVAGFQVKRYSRLTIKTSLESAKILGAVKMEEVVDRDKIKELYEQGTALPDVSEIHYIVVSKKLSKTPQQEELV